MSVAEQFADMLTADAPLAERLGVGMGGPARLLAEPENADRLAALLRACRAEALPVRVLGNGSNVLAPAAGIDGVVIHLKPQFFGAVGPGAEANTFTAGGGALLTDVIAHTCAAGCSGLEILVGIPASVGGAVRRNAGGRTGDIGQFVESVRAMDLSGEVHTLRRTDLRFAYRDSNLADRVVLSATFRLTPDDKDRLGRRLKSLWIARKATQPFGFERSALVFRDPRGLSAADLIERTGLVGLEQDGVELSPRDPRYVVVKEGAAPAALDALIDRVRSRVASETGVDLPLQVDRW